MKENSIYLERDECSNLWATKSRSSAKITKLTGGITNILYLVTPIVQEVVDSMVETEGSVIIRIYGAGTADIIDRNVENLVFAQLSQSNFGPTFYGLFENGRVEGYIHNSRGVSPLELADNNIYPLIAKSLVQLHMIHMAQLCNNSTHTEAWLWRKISLFIDSVVDSYSELKDLRSKHVQLGVDLDVIQSEYSWLKTNIESSSTSSEIHDNKGVIFGYDSVLCHNDLLAGNILLARKENNGLMEDRAVIIDYEYCMYNYRAYDIANHFCEYCGFDFDLKLFPDELKRKSFLTAYINEYATQVSDEVAKELKTIEFLNEFERTVCKFVLASHLFWGSWAVYQSLHSSIDFDYFEYAKKRFATYFHHKDIFSGLFTA